MRRDQEPRTFDTEDRTLDPCDETQVQAWAEFYDVSPDVIRETCATVGPNRVAVEMKLAAPRA